MAIQQVVSVYISLKGDGTSTTFTFPLENMYQQAFGGSIPYGTTGVVPGSITVTNPPVPVTSATIDANGNITITLTSALGSGVVQNFEIDLLFASGSATSSSASQVENVSVFAGTTAITATGSSLNVDVTNTVTVSGTVTANAGTGTFNTSDANAQTQGSTTSGQKGFLDMGAVTTSAPSYTTGQTSPFSLDTSGNLRTSVNNNITLSQGGSVLSKTNPIFAAPSDGTNQMGLMTAYGTAASGYALPVNAYVTNNIPVTQSGTWSNRIVGNTGSTLDAPSSQNQTAPGAMLLTGAQYNTSPTTITTGNVSPLQMDSVANLKINVAASSLTDPAEGVTASSLPAKAIQIGGSTTTAVPSYTTGTLNAVSLTTLGGLRIDTSSVNSVALGSPSNYGTSPGVVIVPGVNAYVTNLVGIAGQLGANTPQVAVDVAGQLLISDQGGLGNLMLQILWELRAMKQAIIQGTHASPLDEDDFIATNFSNDWEPTSII